MLQYVFQAFTDGLSLPHLGVFIKNGIQYLLQVRLKDLFNQRVSSSIELFWVDPNLFKVFLKPFPSFLKFLYGRLLLRYDYFLFGSTAKHIGDGL
jgi:hypothetical protein